MSDTNQHCSALADKLLNIRQTGNSYPGMFGRGSKHPTKPTTKIGSQKYVTFNSGDAGNGRTIMMKEEKVEAWFGKQLRIILERVDEVKEEKTSKEGRPQSESHLNETFASGKGEHENQAVPAGFSCHDNLVNGRIKEENRLMSEDESVVSSELNYPFVDNATYSENIHDQEIEFGDVQLLSTKVKLEMDLDEQGAMSGTVISSLTKSENEQENQAASKENREQNVTIPSQHEKAVICFNGTITPETNNDQFDVSMEDFSSIKEKGKEILKNSTNKEEKLKTRSNSPAALILLITVQNSKPQMMTSPTEKLTSFSDASVKFDSKDALGTQLEISCQPKKYICAHCDKKFPGNGKLQLHIRTHTGEKPFECSFCSASFSDKGCLKRHIRTHTGEKPFQCSYCGATFSQKGSLNQHIRTHTNEKPFECSYCCATFSRKCSLNKHIRIHTNEKPFECSYCCATFSRKYSLIKHIRIHMGEKPFQCSYCRYASSDKFHLKQHIRTHTGEKPFECSYCSATFSQKGSLKQHIRTHTNE